MSLTITPSSAGVNLGLTQTFVASAGVEPYVFSLVDGIGSIDPVTGVYTAPIESGAATVRVTDDDGDTAEAAILVNSPLTHLCNIIQSEMSLNNDQVYLWDQKLNIPKDTALYVAVAVMTCKPFGNSRRMVGTDDALFEEQSINMMATLSLDIMSRGPIARDRKEEVLLALNSTLSEQTQEANGFYIAPLPTGFVNLSEIDGSAIPYRFNISVVLQYKVTKTKAVQFYDEFSLDEPLIEP